MYKVEPSKKEKLAVSLREETAHIRTPADLRQYLERHGLSVSQPFNDALDAMSIRIAPKRQAEFIDEVRWRQDSLLRRALRPGDTFDDTRVLMSLNRRMEAPSAMRGADPLIAAIMSALIWNAQQRR